MPLYDRGEREGNKPRGILTTNKRRGRGDASNVTDDVRAGSPRSVLEGDFHERFDLAKL